LAETEINTSRTGIQTDGPGSVNIFDTIVDRAAYGLISSGHVNLANTTFTNNQIGMLMEGGYRIEQVDCSIINYSSYGVEIETWDHTSSIPINMTGGTDARADLAFWGRMDIRVQGPNGEDVEGATLNLESNMGMDNQISKGSIGLIWGYRQWTTPINYVQYTLTGSWGNAEDSVEFSVTRGGIVELVLPLTDIHIDDLKLKNGDAVVDLGANWTEAREVTITVYLDGSYRFSKRISLSEGENVTMELPLGDVEAGKHELKAVISSNDEYTGMNGMLQNNNEMIIEIDTNEDDKDGGLQVVPIILLIVAILFIILVILFKRKD